VKFRTNEASSQSIVWREGMADWSKILDVPELRDILIESKSEVIDQFVSQT
jgi:hypothetical protein